MVGLSRDQACYPNLGLEWQAGSHSCDTIGKTEEFVNERVERQAE